MGRHNPQSEKMYGFVGWREILQTRQDLLDRFDRAKEYTSSRPVKTEHGPAGEASIRSWLESLLPSKYGVTSGYIIPGLISEAYTLYHYDVIIYDRLNSPILWIDDNPDQSPQGKRRAIPAEHVHGVFEIKSQFTTAHAKEAIRKLGELNQLSTHLPKNFTSCIVFFELDSGLANKPRMLKHLFPDHPIMGYWGGLILRCDLNPLMTGLFELIHDESASHAQDPEDTTLVKDVDTVEVWRTEGGSIKLAHGASIFLYADGRSHHASKTYTCLVTKHNEYGVMVSWSYNCFSQFVIRLLLALEGKSWRGGKPEPATFGYVFDKLDIRPD